MKEMLIFFIQGILEGTGLIAFSLAIARITINWKNTFIVGFIMAVISYTLRTLSFFFGFHTFVILFLIMFYVSRTGQVPLVKSFLVTFVSAITLGVLEFSTNTAFFLITGLSQQEVTSNKILWATLGMPQAILIMALAVITSRVLKPK